MWEALIGKKIVAYRGQKTTDSRKIELTHILFDDNETYIELREQDHYDYHDCDNSARRINIWKNEKAWKRLFDKEFNFDEPNCFLS